MDARAQVRSRVMARDRTCRAAGLAPGPCGGPLDVHELVRRSQWRDGYLVDDNCVLICRVHHDWVTTHPVEAHDLGLHRWSWERPS